MSATGRGAVRKPHDQYDTPRWAVDCVIERLIAYRYLDVGPVLEPACGLGDIAIPIFEALIGFGRRFGVNVSDIDPDRVQHTLELAIPLQVAGYPALAGISSERLRPDFLQSCLRAEYGLIITNPPFSLYAAPKPRKGHPEDPPQGTGFLRTALAGIVSGGHVVLLLRMGHLLAACYAWVWTVGLKHVWGLSPRPSFDGKGNDATEYAWVVWEKGWTGGVTIERLQKGPRRDWGQA